MGVLALISKTTRQTRSPPLHGNPPDELPLCPFFSEHPPFFAPPCEEDWYYRFKKKIAQVWYKKKKEGKTTLSKSERKTVLQLASLIPG